MTDPEILSCENNTYIYNIIKKIIMNNQQNLGK
jgi:hypothetical protein